MKIIVGLGNPGEQYKNTRHNIGFDILDQWGSIHWSKKFQSLTSDIRFQGKKAIFIKPQTYMNLSGQAVGEALRFYKDCTAADIMVIHDDLDLQVGQSKFKQGGGHGGHNGLKSIDAHIGNLYHRLRIGIGHPGEKKLVSQYVLSKFYKQEALLLEEHIQLWHQAIGYFLQADHDALRQCLTRHARKPSTGAEMNSATQTANGLADQNKAKETPSKLASLLSQLGLNRKEQ